MSIIYFIFIISAANPPQASWCSIWDGKPSKIYVLAVHYAWSVYILLFNCVVLNIRAYGRDHLSINTVAIGFSEIFGVFIGMYLVLYTRRRWLWVSIKYETLFLLTYSECSILYSNCIIRLDWEPSELDVWHI